MSTAAVRIEPVTTMFITKSGHYYLGQNVRFGGNGRMAICIQANNVHIDLGGFELCNASCQAANGIYAENKCGLSITNGVISGFNSTVGDPRYGAGIRFEGVSRFTITNLTVKDSFSGIRLLNCNMASVEGVNLSSLDGNPMVACEGPCACGNEDGTPPNSACVCPSEQDCSETNDFRAPIPEHGTGLFFLNTHNVYGRNIKMNNIIQGIYSFGCQNHDFSSVFMRGPSLVRGMTVPTGENHLYDKLDVRMGTCSFGFGHIGVGSGYGGSSSDAYPGGTSGSMMNGIQITNSNLHAQTAQVDTSGFLFGNTINAVMYECNLYHSYNMMVNSDAAVIRHAPGIGFQTRGTLIKDVQVAGMAANGIHLQACNSGSSLGNPVLAHCKVSMSQYVTGIKITSGPSAATIPSQLNENAFSPADEISPSAPILENNYIAGAIPCTGNNCVTRPKVGISTINTKIVQLANNYITNQDVGISVTGSSNIGLVNNVAAGNIQSIFIASSVNLIYSQNNIFLDIIPNGGALSSTSGAIITGTS